MKYIKKFNENVSNELEGLSEFLDDYFVEFSDMGFVIDSEYQIGFDGNVWLEIVNKESGFFNWDDIKDVFIPFFEMLNSKFRIYHVKFGIANNDDASILNINNNENMYSYAVRNDSIIDDKLPNSKLFKIRIHIKF